jgi:dolichyl-phosphate-mannose-protein mannosyltransferase
MPSKVAWRVVLAIAAVKFLVQFYASGSYHYFRDELYYIACGHHLAWGFVDHPPLVAIYARIGEWLGPSLRGFRLLPTLAGTLRVILTGVLAARLGGSRLAQGVACTAVLMTPAFFGIDSLLSMNSFEHVIWLGCLLVVVEIANGADERWWLAFGALAGLGLQNKHSIVFLAGAIVVALVLTPLRRSLARPWIYLGGLVALLIFLPNLVWEIQQGFPTLELLRNVKETGKNVVLAPVPFVIQQAMMLDPFSAPLWIAGLFALFFARDLSRYRVLGWTYVILLVLFIRLEAKDYYVAPIYPVLFAAGAVWLFSERAGRARRAAGWVMIVLTVFGGVISAPMALPLLDPEALLAYQRRLGVKQHPTETSFKGELSQHFADQFGWEEMVQRVAQYYNSLPPDLRSKTAIYTGNYGEAGAIDFYGPKYGLPRAISPHQSYYVWGPRDYTGESMILLEDSFDTDMFQSVALVGHTDHPWAMSYENLPIYHARGLKVPLRTLWPKLKNWR